MRREDALLRIDGATLVKGGRRILDGLSLEVTEGQHTAILGPNGSGKSSLIKLITRQHYPLARADGPPPVTIFGRARWDIFELRALLGIVSSDLHQEFTGVARLRGEEAVLSGFFAGLGLAAHHAVTPGMQERAQAALAWMEASALADKPLAEMSTGEARRVLIARALVTDPRALLLDEPTAGLDLVARRRFLETLRRVAARGKTVILVTHHVEEVLPEIGRVVLLRDGHVFRDGPKRDVLTTETLSALFGTPVHVREQAGYFTAEATLGVV
ncbi:MAG: ATP-binding cassette domain-containing protein [Armatimonadetes bacterium]|nr:ATP-binding cassette domain-containing protein [Armatimonadota bacterium]